MTYDKWLLVLAAITIEGGLSTLATEPQSRDAMVFDLESIRREYLQGGLHREDLRDDPIAQFKHWMEQSIAAQIPDPSAMTLATVDGSGQPSQRIVLLKGLDEKGFVFYTNLRSRKARELAENPRASLHFPWHFRTI